MTSFFFKAVASDGKLRTGTISAESDKWVAKELRRQGLTPVYVGLQEQSSFELKLPTLSGSRRKDVLFFTQELATLLNAGVPLDRALAISTELTESPAFRLVLTDVLRVLKGGRSLADSLGTHPDHFGNLYVNMVRAGEASGALGPIFDRLSEFERTRDELRGYILSALIYPGLLTVVGFASITVLLTFVVPRFASIFTDSRLKPPLPMKIMLEVSDILKTFGLPALGCIAGIGLLVYLYVKTDVGRLWWDTLRLKLPLLGDVVRKAETARFARSMSTLVANSVPLVQSINIAGTILSNRRISNTLEGIAQGVKRGEGIAVPLKRSGEFPALAGHLLSVGEETGRLDQMFARMADIYEADTKAAVKRFTSLFEPIIILVMGVIVGGLILSIMLAITSINEVALG
jgi:general secretion pathway protein F